MKCWCKVCGCLLKTKREYIDQEDTCDRCFKGSDNAGEELGGGV